MLMKTLIAPFQGLKFPKVNNVAIFFVGLFYDAVNNEIGAEMAYLEANKLNQAAAVAEAKALREEEIVKDRLARGEHESEDKGMHV